MAIEFDAAEYLARVTSEHIDKQKFMETIRVSVAPLVDIQTTVWNMVEDFDLDAAIGKQLDAIGTRVGLSRTIELFTPDPWFTWDVVNLGWDGAPWYAGDQSSAGTQDLTDDQYRLLLRARIVANKWDSTVPEAYKAYDMVFPYFGCDIFISPYRYMEMMICIIKPTFPDPLELGLFWFQYLPLRPNGMYMYRAWQSVVGEPVFCWDAPEGDPNCLGWDEGNWVIVDNLIGLLGGVNGTES